MSVEGRAPARNGYGLLDRTLHRLALGIPALAELSFDLDQMLSRAAGQAASVATQPHLFVTGLARAGTTALVRSLHASGGFRSLTYRDMPFPLAPNLWARLSGRWRAAHGLRPRAHGDGLMVNADSIEAFEEVFWRIQLGGAYIRPDALEAHDVDEAVIRRFRHYVAAVLASAGPGQTRYLSKNNNNILRLPALHAALPHAHVLLPFRRPADHAHSLWRQHLHFCAVQTADPFARRYMDWLVHHEFGTGHRRFRFGGSPAPDLTPDRPDYWLALWIEVHEALIGQAHPRNLFVSLEALCADPSIWRALRERLALSDSADPVFRPARAVEETPFDASLLARAKQLHAGLCALAAP